MSSKKNDGKIVIALIIALIAFGLGSGIGISVGMSGDDLNSTQKKSVNTTINVTNNISQDNAYYDMDITAYEEPVEETNSSDVPSSVIYYPEENFSNETDQNEQTTTY